VSGEAWLSPLAALPEVLNALILSPDGIPIETLREAGPPAGALAAECAALAQAAAEASGRLSGGRVYRLALTVDRFALVLLRLERGVAVAVFADRSADLRRLENEAAGIATRLAAEVL